MKKPSLPIPDDALPRIQAFLRHLQKTICNTLATLDGTGTWIEDGWTRLEGGGGMSCVMQDGSVFEKAGVNFSHVTGNALPAAATSNRPELRDCRYTAMGVSLVIHPNNPYVPTTHANVRFFVAEKEDALPIWWFGGGFDLTPYYGFQDDCIHWHQTAKKACDPFGETLYPEFKAWADRYFYLHHRQEARGIGGLFFDDYQQHDFEQSFLFMQSVGNHFLKAYTPIVLKRQLQPFGEREKNFQRYRRGRYVEFNLIHDRGTLFGLQSGGRTESILMSLPPQVTWQYNWHPEEGTPEAALYQDFLPAKNWILADSTEPRP